jgi:zinc protease
MKRKFMVRWFSRMIFAVMVLGIPWGSVSRGAEAAQMNPAATPLKVPPLKYRQRTLANGLSFFSIENHRGPTVAIQVWYHVGGKDDPPGRSGFAHLFEHLMFKATKNQKSENFDRLTEGVGGANNAFTQEDVTVYHETVPSNYLETLLWAEADRMANLNVDEGDFSSERAVVEEEYRQGVLASPYGRLDIYIEQNSFAVHPYKRGVIGSIADLDSASIEDVRKFHATYYRPDNATLIVSGDFDPGQLDTWVDHYFGRIHKPAASIPRVTVTEPPRTKEARVNTTGPNVPLPATAITYLLPPRKSDDFEALQVAEVILGRGESSRMNQSLVYQQQIAASVSVNADLRDDAGLFGIIVTTAGGKAAGDAEKAALVELEKLKQKPITAVELDKARNLLLAQALGARETPEGQAFALGRAAVNFGDPDRINTEIERLQAVTAADVQRVAQKYLILENCVIVRYENGQEAQGGQSNAPKANPLAASPAFVPEETPPTPAAPRAATFPTPIEKKLSNGVGVVAVPRPGTGLVSVSANIKAGSVLDPNAAAGLADFTASLLTRGTKNHSAPQIAEAIEALGASLSSAAGWDAANVQLSSLSTRLVDAVPMFAEVVRHPAFATEEIERLRSESLDGLTVSFREPGTLARLTAGRVVFGESGYGHSRNGTPETIKALDAGQISRFYQSWYQPQNTVLVFGGDITMETALALATKYFGDWKADPVAPPLPPPPAATQGGRVLVVDKPDAGQAAVCVARATIRRADKEYEVGRVANAVLGEGYSARMNQEVRIKRGLSYGASSNLGARKESGLFLASAQTRNDAAPEVAMLMKKELVRLASEPVEAAELVTRKAALSGNYARELQTGAGLVSAVASLAAGGLPLSSLNDYLPQVQKVSPSQIQSFAAEHLGADNASVIIVGDGRQFLTELKKQFPNVEVIPVDKLDLNKTGLVN